MNTYEIPGHEITRKVPRIGTQRPMPDVHLWQRVFTTVCLVWAVLALVCGWG